MHNFSIFTVLCLSGKLPNGSPESGGGEGEGGTVKGANNFCAQSSGNDFHRHISLLCSGICRHFLHSIKYAYRTLRVILSCVPDTIQGDLLTLFSVTAFIVRPPKIYHTHPQSIVLWTYTSLAPINAHTLIKYSYFVLQTTNHESSENELKLSVPSFD